MNKTIAICLLPVFAAGLFAQGPRSGGFGGGNGGGFGGWSGRGPGMMGAGPGMMGAGPGRQGPVTGEPYSATETVTTLQTLVGNQITHTQQTTVARDSQGRVSTTETVTPPASSGKAPFTIQTIFDPVAGYQYVLDSSSMIARQMQLPKRMLMGSGAAPLAPRTPPARPNVVTTSLGTQLVNGVQATGTQVTQTIPAGAIGNAQPIQNVRIVWISNALQVPVQMKTSDARFGTTDMELTNIVQAEPNGSLFVVPAGYTIQQGGRGGRGPGGVAGGGPRRGDRQPPQ